MSETPHLNVHVKILPLKLFSVLPARFNRREEQEVKKKKNLQSFTLEIPILNSMAGEKGVGGEGQEARYSLYS